MAKIIRSGKGDSKMYSIVGLKAEEFFTLLDILDDSLYEAEKEGGKYSEKQAKRIIHSKRCSTARSSEWTGKGSESNHTHRDGCDDVTAAS